ncbi:MAG TPA: peptidase M48, partial [Gammaproteobacteria bacterium]|nr:peptidase M48 [Gammaproteobacteria bacterium]
MLVNKYIARCSIGLLLSGLLVLSGCATNPVTGKRELHLVSQAQEIQIGQQSYLPSRQSQGGE